MGGSNSTTTTRTTTNSKSRVKEDSATATATGATVTAAVDENSFCKFCGCFLDKLKSYRCNRCHATLISCSSNAPNIEQIWIGIFEDSLKECDKKDKDKDKDKEEEEVSGEYLIDNYLKPYFSKQPDTIVYSGVHWFINKVHFKVYRCYPPIGKINSETKYHLEDENSNEKQLLKLHSHFIRHIHILPTLVSYESYQRLKKIQKGSIHHHHHRHQEQNWNMELFDTHIKSFFNQPDEYRYDNDNNNHHHNDNIHENPTIYNCDEKENKNNIIVPSYRHLVVGETFMSKGVQFRVMACEPSDGLIKTELETIISVRGKPLPDITNLSVQVVYETLSDEQKQMSSDQFHARYLTPYFKGRFRHINQAEYLNVFGVQMTVSCEPTDGIVTELTNIEADDLRYRQEEHDREMAQRLQEEEQEDEPEEEQEEEEDGQYPRIVIRNREQFPRFIAEVSENLDAQNAEPMALAMMYLLQHLQQMDENQGLPVGDMERLPLYEYKAVVKDDQSNSTSDEQTCRICLVDFENGDKLRLMPCFHRYHQDCIDRWLEMNHNCPICKTDVFQTLRQDRDD